MAQGEGGGRFGSPSDLVRSPGALQAWGDLGQVTLTEAQGLTFINGAINSLLAGLL